MTDTLTEREGFKMVRGPAEVGDTLESAKAMLIDANLFCLRTHQKITPVGEGEIRKLIAIIGAAQDEIAALREDAERYRWLCNGNGYFMEEENLCGYSNDKADADTAIDKARNAKKSPD